jgi:hypothetical protein
MAYIDQTWTGENAKEHARDTSFMGANLPNVAEQVDRLELHCSNFSDPGADWCEFRAFDNIGKLIATRRMPGY